MKILILFSFFIFSSCFDIGCTDPGYDSFKSYYEPVTIKRADLNTSIAFQDAEVMSESSKIYIFDNYIFINDKRKGFHIFDNSDPKNPIKKKFLKIPGATDIAIRNNTFFINQATDLVSLSIDLNTFKLNIDKRLENVFPRLESPDGFYESVKKEEIIVNWIKK
ncbi:hypothetical protein [Tenacibaculum finnmarkense]|uniref:hypothetical protein n=1 Tax=Tenacibaculum finnmarkense TaxID=2781243 RepID=UPI00187B8A6C|nr:hypothetical protein [Tenacibaculum finnmarkense]MBE7692102.1 hypothetical protein [Tenacibaculum finnmarkense genomovar finnmarkense]